MAEQARGTRVGRDVGAPTLGDLVTDGLAARGVDPGSLAWDAARELSGPWVVLARFAVGDVEHEARWTFDLAKRTVVADEDEARLAVGDRSCPTSRSRVATSRPCRDVVFDFQGDGTLRTPQDVAPSQPEPVPDPQEETASLLDDLRSRAASGRPSSSTTTTPRSSRASGRSTRSTSDGPTDRARRPPGRRRPAAEAQCSRRPSPWPEPVSTPAAEHDDTERPAGPPGRAKGPELGRDRLRRKT